MLMLQLKASRGKKHHLCSICTIKSKEQIKTQKKNTEKFKNSKLFPVEYGVQFSFQAVGSLSKSSHYALVRTFSRLLKRLFLDLANLGFSLSMLIYFLIILLG